MKLDDDETTGDNDFKNESAPDVYAVVIDEGSEKGYVGITSVGKPFVKILTGEGSNGYRVEEISTGQMCMLYGCPTVWFIRPC